MRWVLMVALLMGCAPSTSALRTEPARVDVAALDTLIRANPQTARVLSYHFDAWRTQQAQTPNAPASIQRATELYHVVRLADAGASQDLDDATYGGLRAEIESALRGAAIRAHMHAKKARSTRDYVFAYALYDQHIEVFGAHPQAGALALYRAEILYTSGKWRAAIDGYERALTWRLRPAHRKMSLEGIVYARGELMRDSAPPPHELPVALGAPAQAYIDACARFVRAFPKDANAPVLRFQIATVYKNHGHIEEAIAALLLLERAHPRHALARRAHDLRAALGHALSHRHTP